MAEFYVDPTNGVDSGAADGSIGNPYASVQYCHDNAAGWSTTSANTIWLANTSADVLAASLNLTRNAIESPLIIAGYDAGGSITATTFRGQVVVAGEIDGNDVAASIINNEAYLILRNLKLHSTTSSVVYFGALSQAYHCEVYHGGTITFRGGSDNMIRNCRIYGDTYTANWEVLRNSGVVVDCEIYGGDRGLYNSVSGHIIGCLIHDVRDSGVYFVTDNMTIVGCTIDGIGADSDGVGVRVSGATLEGNSVIDCLITNWDGGTSCGVKDFSGGPLALLANNHYYNNTTNESLTHTPHVWGAAVTEGADPYTNSATDDFSLVSGAAANGAATLSRDPANPSNVGYWQDDSAGETDVNKVLDNSSLVSGAVNVANVLNTETHGTYVPAAAANVKTGVTFGAASAETGTYTGSDRWTDPGVANVRTGTAYKADSTTNNRTGTCAVPTAAQVLIGVSVDATTGTVTQASVGDVRNGTTFGPSLGLTGTAHIPAAANVLSGVNVDATTGTYVTVATGDVQSGVTFGAASALTGTFAAPVAGDVRSGTTYGNAGEFTGTCAVPAAGDVQSGVAVDATTGTFVSPAVGDVQSGVTYGNAGEFTGVFAVPAVGDVEAGVAFGNAGEFTGTFAVPAVGDVEDGVFYGAGGTEFEGTLVAGGGSGETVNVF